MKTSRCARFVRIVACSAAFCAGYFPHGGPAAAASPAPPASPSPVAKAKCAAGDANVYLNSKTKVYVLDTSTSTAWLTKSGAMEAMRSACTSQAKKDGARPATPAESKRMGHP